MQYSTFRRLSRQALRGVFLLFVTFHVHPFETPLQKVIQLLLICALIFFTLLWYFDSFDAQILLDFIFYLLNAAANCIGQLGAYSLDIDYLASVASNAQINVLSTKDAAVDNGVYLIHSLQSLVDAIGIMLTRRYIYNQARVVLLDGAHFLEHLADQIPVLDDYTEYSDDTPVPL